MPWFVLPIASAMARYHRELLAEPLTLTLENPGGSLWLRRR
jgi:hypothetical protein